MSVFYRDKSAFDSKKFKMTMISMVAMILTPVVSQYFGPITPTIVEQVAPYIVSGFLGMATMVYNYSQAKIDTALVTVKGITESETNK